jgi:hypothetical protein
VPIYGGGYYRRLQVAEQKEILKALLEALQEKADDEEDKDLKTIFREVRDELRTLNGTTKEDRTKRQAAEEMEELARTTYPALRSHLAGATHLEHPQG